MSEKTKSADFNISEADISASEVVDFITTSLARIQELEGKVLGCWCKPQDCHGDVLVELIDGKEQDG